ncbi:MAG TPA: hypothetical protein VGP70_20105 [Actinomadura sp.]|nr:hypothetical protein [Actinomadura sp.]
MTPEEARVLAVVGHELFLATRGTPLGDRMNRPEPGDLVLEVTHFGHGWDPNRIGRLVRIEGKAPDERYIVEPAHDPEQHREWRHCRFIALPAAEGQEWLNGHRQPVRTRYQPLTDYLRQDGRERIEMAFEDIESIMGETHLPPSARNPRLPQWWDNDFGNPQAQGWMRAGYQVEAVDISEQRVRFRSHNREES